MSMSAHSRVSASGCKFQCVPLADPRQTKCPSVGPMREQCESSQLAVVCRALHEGSAPCGAGCRPRRGSRGGTGGYKRWRRDRFTRRALKEYKRLVDERFSYLIGREYVYTADDGAVTQWRVIEPIAYSYGLGVRLQAVDDAKQEQSPYIWPIDPVEAEATQKDWPMGGVRQDPDPHWRRADHADCEAAEDSAWSGAGSRSTSYDPVGQPSA